MSAENDHGGQWCVPTLLRWILRPRCAPSVARKMYRQAGTNQPTLRCYNLNAYQEVKARGWMTFLVATRSLVGEWLSLVEHLVRDQGVGGSNPRSEERRVGEECRSRWS